MMRRENKYNENMTQIMNIPVMLKANVEAAGEILNFFIEKKNIDKESLISAILEVIPAYSEDYNSVISNFPVEVDEKWKAILEPSNLIKLLKCVFFTTINFKKYEKKVQDGKVELDMEDAVPGYYLCEFCVCKALTKVLPLDKAIEHIQTYTKLIHERPNPRRKKFDKLSEFREWLEPLCRDSHEFISDIEEDDSEYRFYVTKCWWAEALQKYNSPEIFTAMICYGDYSSAKQYNENFILTRNKTRMGDDCCDFCYQDTRKKHKTSHLPEEKWKELTNN